MKSIKYILASNSPRRRQLLTAALSNVSIAESREVDESYPDSLPASEVAQYIASKKAEAYRDLVKDDETILITADTVVVCEDKILGKPADRADAVSMLKMLSGKTHHVYTGYAIVSEAIGVKTYSERTEVKFKQLSDSEIEHYVDKAKPFDKAGAYGIQEWIGLIGIESIRGDFYNVMGLPVCALYHRLEELMENGECRMENGE